MPPYEIRCYKISWDNNTDVYVVSTEQRVSSRMSGHRSDARKGKPRKICEAIRKYGYDFDYVMLESCLVNNTDEKRMREQEWIDKLNSGLNMIRAYSTKEDHKKKHQKWYDANIQEITRKQNEYRRANKDDVNMRARERYQSNKEKQKLYYQANKEKILRKQGEYRQANREKKKEYRRANRENINKKMREYSLANREKINRKQRERRQAKKLQQLNQEPKKEVAVAQQQIQEPINASSLT